MFPFVAMVFLAIMIGVPSIVLAYKALTKPSTPVEENLDEVLKDQPPLTGPQVDRSRGGCVSWNRAHEFAALGVRRHPKTRELYYRDNGKWCLVPKC